MDRLKVILDTDIGDDIDDAFALSLLYANKNIDLIGVTTVFRNTVARAKQVKEFFSLYNENGIPVRVGLKHPIKEPIRYFEKDIKDEFGVIWPCQYDQSYDKYILDHQTAVDFIIESSFKYENELILIPIGPLTNIAQAMIKDPSIKNRIKKIVLMGGWFTNEEPEWNIMCDPEAASIVFNSGVDVYCVGLDVTLQCDLDQSLLSKLYESQKPIHQLLTTWIKRWFDHFNFEKSVLHDPLTIACLFDNDICEFKKMSVEVDLTHRRGMTVVNQSNNQPNVYVAVNVNKEKFYHIFTQYLTLDEVNTSQI